MSHRETPPTRAHTWLPDGVCVCVSVYIVTYNMDQWTLTLHVILWLQEMNEVMDCNYSSLTQRETALKKNWQGKTLWVKWMRCAPSPSLHSFSRCAHVQSAEPPTAAGELLCGEQQQAAAVAGSSKGAGAHVGISIPRSYFASSTWQIWGYVSQLLLKKIKCHVDKSFAAEKVDFFIKLGCLL